MRNKKIVMAGSLTYKAPTKIGIHHYASLFAKNGWDVFFLSSQLSPLHLIRKQDRIYSKEKLRLWMRGGELEGNILSYSYMTMLPILPFWSSDFFIKNTLNLTLPRLAKVLKRSGFDNPDIIWIENPHLIELPSMVKHKGLIVRINDELSGFEGYSSFILERYEDTIILADLVVNTARGLFEKYRKMNLDDRVMYVPNGVDFTHFSANYVPEPKEYEMISKPIVIYVGAIAHWFDQELVIKCARQLNNMSFVLIGPQMVDTARMKAVPNIYMLGSKPYDTLPSYIRGADVGIIPFKVNKLVTSVNPLKLYEYMAAGLPVVCTDWKEMREMVSPAMLAGDMDEFCEYIKSSLEIKDKTEIISYARNNSWENRFHRIRCEIERYLGK